SSPARRLRRIFHGVWGSALFQRVYQPAPGYVGSLPLMPEWYLIVVALAGISGAVVSWKPLPIGLLLAAIGVSASRAGAATLRASFPTKHESAARRLALCGLTALLYLLQPLWRLDGRLRHGLSPWRRGRVQGWAWPRLQIWKIWSERWRAHDDWLHSIETSLRAAGARVVRGGPFDQWDLEVASGPFGSVRITTVIEEHGAGKQLARLRLSPRCSRWVLSTMVVSLGLAVIAALHASWIGSGFLGT